VILRQLGERNLTPSAIAYLRGTGYLLEQAQGRRTDLEPTSAQNDQKSTADRLGKEYGVSGPTIRRNAEFARKINAFAARHGGDEVVELLLSPLQDLARKDLGALLELDESVQGEILERMRHGDSDVRSSLHHRIDTPSMGTSGPTHTPGRDCDGSDQENRGDGLDAGSDPCGGSRPTEGDATNVQEGPQTTHEEEREQEIEGAEGDVPRPAIFDDVPEIEGAAVALESAVDFLDMLLRGWREEPGHDVDHLLPELEKMRAECFANVHRIRNEMIPQQICSDCGATGDDCTTCHGRGWLSSADLAGTGS
jgi:hypothetical protein